MKKERRTAVLKVIMRPSEKAACDAAAEAEGKGGSEWARPILAAAVKRASERGGIPVHAPNKGIDGGDA